MTDFNARIEGLQRQDRERDELTAFLRLELDRQLQALGKSMIEFRTQHRLARWVDVYDEAPTVTWSMKKDSMFGPKYAVPSLRGTTTPLMLVRSPYAAYVTKEGNWVYAHGEVSYFDGDTPMLTPPSTSYIVQKGPVVLLFSAGRDKVLSGAIPEVGSDYDPIHWYLDMPATGTVGKSVGDRRFSLEDTLAEVLRGELIARNQRGTR